MNELTILPPLEIERVTELLEAASWCKTQEMELILAKTIKKFIHPPMFFKGDESNGQEGK